MINVINNLDQIAARYKSVFCDLWGCLHNGKESFESSLKALLNFKASGGVVILLTNAPRPSNTVKTFLDKMGLDKKIQDHVFSSGEAALNYLKNNSFIEMDEFIKEIKNKKKKIGVFPISESNWIDTGIPKEGKNNF